MVIAFVSNYYNHHQSDFSENMYRLTEGNFYFIATEPMWDERKKLGYKEEFPPFLIKQYLNDENRIKSQKIIDEADVVIIGSAPDSLIKKRLKSGLLTFRYSERLYKTKPAWYKLPIHALKFWYHSGRYNNLYMLCSSAYTSSDLYTIHSFRRKCFKWGYFPKLKTYPNIKDILNEKEDNSILWVARLIELKHPEAPIIVAKRLKDAGYKFNLSIIGIGPLQHQLQDLIQKFSIEQEVHLLGAMSPDDVREYMEKNTLFLFTSDKNEGWGAVLNESMNSACAVISSHAIGSSPFLINDGVNGLIYKDGDIDDLYLKTKWLLDNKSNRSEMGLKAYETILKEWNAEVASKRLLHLIECLNREVKSPYLEGPCSNADLLYDNWK